MGLLVHIYLVHIWHLSSSPAGALKHLRRPEFPVVCVSARMTPQCLRRRHRCGVLRRLTSCKSEVAKQLRHMAGSFRRTAAWPTAFAFDQWIKLGSKVCLRRTPCSASNAGRPHARHSPRCQTSDARPLATVHVGSGTPRHRGWHA